LTGRYADPPWLTFLDWNKIVNAPAFEPALGNPDADGYLLSSTITGIRSWIAPAAGSGGVSSVFSRTGDVLAVAGDYASYYVSLTGSYADPAWITSLAYSKITGVPAPPAVPVQSVFGRIGDIIAQAGDYGSFYLPLSYTPPVSSVFTRTGAITAQVGDYSAFYPQLTGAYADPAWITSLAYSKLTGVPVALVSSVFTRTGAVVAAGTDYASFYPQLTGSYADPAWITSLAYSKLTGVPAFEPALGNPSANGMVLSSTALGVRSWITPSAGGLPSGGAKGMLLVKQSATDYDAAFSDHITYLDANASSPLTVLTVEHDTSGTPGTDFGVTLGFALNGKSSGLMMSGWSDATAGNETSYFEWYLASFGTAPSRKMRLWGSGGLTVGIATPTDPSLGIIAVGNGFRVGNAGVAVGRFLYSDGAKYVDSPWSLPASGSAGQTLIVAPAGSQPNTKFATFMGVNGPQSSPAATTSTSGVMAGMATYFTPVVTGRVLVIFNGAPTSSVAGAWVAGFIRYGAGTAPVNGAAPVGTQIGPQWLAAPPIAGQWAGASMSAVIAGLTIGTQYWVDVVYRVPAGNSGGITQAAFTITEF
jgi:hypothetical protein